jgi:hypothetical protein
MNATGDNEMELLLGVPGACQNSSYHAPGPEPHERGVMTVEEC